MEGLTEGLTMQGKFVPQQYQGQGWVGQFTIIHNWTVVRTSPCLTGRIRGGQGGNDLVLDSAGRPWLNCSVLFEGRAQV